MNYPICHRSVSIKLMSVAFGLALGFTSPAFADAPPAASSNAAIDATAQSLAQAYQTYLNALDKHDVNSVSMAVNRFAATMKNAPEAQCIQAAIAYKAFFDEICQTLTKDLEQIEGNASTAFIKVHRDDYLRNGIYLSGCEGFLSCHRALLKDSHTFLKPFLECASPQVRAYFALPIWGNCEGWISPGSFADIAKFIGERESFLVKFPNSTFQESVANNLDWLRGFFLLFGNCPYDLGAFTRHGDLNPEALTAYRGYIETYPNTPTADLIRRYYAVLEKSQFKFSRSVYDFLKQQTPQEISKALRWDYDMIVAYFASNDNCSIEIYADEHQRATP